ncbi:hypothetical protein OIU77_005966 [Salix suchowensis]|uniref:Uncharacterized protein n=1 Tax=Salix suchowensis TaxID=1278906 RepID=A0ABQ9ASM5_9ROSI|nr:hypothetical protein OIU77_005966 [Salix suchowensis]
MGNSTSATKEALPIDTSFKLPSPLPSLPQGEGFGNGVINLGGGLQVCQIVSLSKIWATNEGGPANPTTGCSMDGILAGKDETGEALKKPIDYTLVWSSGSLQIKQEGVGYIWLPTPPDGYKALGCVVTTSPEKPSLEKVRCARSDLTDDCQADKWIWGQGKESDPNGFNVFSLRPSSRGAQAMGVSVGTFVAQETTSASISLACLKNIESDLSCMPTLDQVQTIFQAYSPRIYFHPDEEYLPSSASWYFTNGALLYKKDEESAPAPIEPTGSSLPQGGSNDGLYWLDLPMEEAERERVKRGRFTILPGQHVGDWEHATLRISNFNGQLRAIYLSAHSGGAWYDASELEFQSGNRAVAYSSLNGHAMYAKPGLVLQGSGNIGIRNDTAKSEKFIDTGARFSVVAAEYMGSSIIEPPWLNYLRKWGPNITYDIAEEVATVENLLPGKLKSAFDKVVKSLPREIFGEEGPTGPKLKRNWIGDEV